MYNIFSTDYYNITNSRGKVARFCLFKHAYKIGEDIIGTCDFTEATIPCVQVNKLSEILFGALRRVNLYNSIIIFY